jgi:hypothetical protein
MKHILLILTLTNVCIACIAQPAFQKTRDTLYVKKGETETYAIKITCTGCAAATKYSVKNTATGDLPATAYYDGANADSINFPAGISEQYFYTTFHPNNDNEYGKQVSYRIFQVGNTTPIGIFHLRLEEVKIKPDLGSYRLLIGTNFDFIDGVDIKAPYYHLQIFQPKGFSAKFGFIGGFQRNRQVSFSDTTNSSIKLRNSRVLYRLPAYLMNDSLYQITQVDSVAFKRTTTSNVFSIYFEPTFQIFPIDKNKLRPTKIFVFGHADIVFRKTITEEEYTYSNPALKTIKLDSFGRFRAVPEKVKNENLNYEFYYGGGIMIHHDNSAVDIYAKFMLGAANIASHQWYYYYGGEIGIREKSLNIMFGAEYRGTGKQYNPNYLNVYLSKVFSLGKLFELIKG